MNSCFAGNANAMKSGDCVRLGGWRAAALGLGLVAAVGALGCGTSSPAAASPGEKAPPGEAWLTPEQVKDLQIKIEPLDNRPVGGTIRSVARVTFDDLRVAHVFSPVTGRIGRILTQPGQHVKKGQPLCTIQSPDLGSASSDLAKAQAALLQAEKDWQRQKELLEVQAAARRDYESAQALYLSAKAEVARAQRKVNLLKQGSQDSVTQEYMLESPIEGEVIMRGANPGLEVQGQYSGGATVELFTVGKLDRVWVLADVFEMDLPRIKSGTPVSVKVVAYPGETFSGHVEWISGALDPASRTAKVRCSIDNRDLKLKPEMYGTALITVDSDMKLAVERSAVFTLGEQTVAFVHLGMTPRGQMRFARRVVAVEETEGGSLIPIKAGLEPKERVVASGGVIFLDML
jgi:cobalt-zinc-cadmium efflux system membrane fusion protein